MKISFVSYSDSINILNSVIVNGVSVNGVSVIGVSVRIVSVKIVSLNIVSVNSASVKIFSVKSVSEKRQKKKSVSVKQQFSHVNSQVNQTMNKICNLDKISPVCLTPRFRNSLNSA